jgi:hypothetical protein
MPRVFHRKSFDYNGIINFSSYLMCDWLGFLQVLFGAKDLEIILQD